MKNPAFSKNPALSLWMSGANSVAGWWMGTATAAARRQQRSLLNDMTKTMTGAMTGAKPKAKRRSKVRRPAR